MYHQMRNALVSILFSFLFLVQAQAHTETFRFLQESENVVFDIQLNDESFGKVDTWLGSSNFRYKKSFGNYDLELLDSDLNVVAYTQKPWGANGEMVTVEVTSTLKKLVFKRGLGGIRLEVVYEDRMEKPVWLQASNDEGVYKGSTDTYVENRTEVIKGGQWISLDERPFETVRNYGPALGIGDRLVLPDSQMNRMTYFHVSSGSQALMLNAENGVVEESMNFISEKAGLKLTLEMAERKVSYEFLGRNDMRKAKTGKVIVREELGENLGTVIRIDSWYRDLVAGPGFQNIEEVTGEYYSPEFGAHYVFREDGFGGLRFEESEENYQGFSWAWNYDGEVVRTDRYMSKSSENNGLGSEEELKTCLANKSACHHIDSRSYRLIQVNRRGLLRNKREYVFLRIMHRPSMLNTAPMMNIQSWIKE